MPELKKVDTGIQQIADRHWIEQMLTNLQSRRWYGVIQIDMKRGVIDLVRIEETLKPPLAGGK